MLCFLVLCSSKKVDHSREQWENAQYSVDCLNKSSISDIVSSVEYVFLILCIPFIVIAILLLLILVTMLFDSPLTHFDPVGICFFTDKALI